MTAGCMVIHMPDQDERTEGERDKPAADEPRREFDELPAPVELAPLMRSVRNAIPRRIE